MDSRKDIRYKEEIKSLWKQCFDDSDEFVNFYFDERYSDKINMAIVEDGQIIAALQMIPYEMTCCNTLISTSYISGACTNPLYRNHGYMRKLLADTHRRMWSDGVLLSTLIPANAPLIKYYEKAGYNSCFGYIAQEIEKKELEYNLTFEESKGSSDSIFKYFDRKMKERPCCIQHSKEDFILIMADIRLSGGSVIIAKDNDDIKGLAFCVINDDKLFIKDILADNNHVESLLLNKSLDFFRKDKLIYLIPSSSNTLYKGMARAIHLDRLLTVFANHHSSVEFDVYIEGDDDIPENNGYYSIRNGICSKGETEGTRYRKYHIKDFVRLLLEMEHPYMSLMLD